MFKHFLVPTDGSELSQQTVARAVSFAKEAGARLTFFYAQEPFKTPSYFDDSLPPDYLSAEDFAEHTRREAEYVLDKARSAAVAAGVPFALETTVNKHPYQAIIEAAERAQCDLIFMASHGRSGFAGVLLGSETQKVLTHSKIPVLVFR